MRISGLLGAVLAFSVLAPIAPIPAHANYIEIVNGEVTLGIGMPHFTAGTFDLADPAWSFENDPNWRTEIVPCALVPWILGEYIAWETPYHPSTPPIIDPVVAAVDPIGLPSSSVADSDPIWTPGRDGCGRSDLDTRWRSPRRCVGSPGALNVGHAADRLRRTRLRRLAAQQGTDRGLRLTATNSIRSRG